MVEIAIQQITTVLGTHHDMYVEKGSHKESVSYEVTSTFYIKLYTHGRKRRFD